MFAPSFHRPLPIRLRLANQAASLSPVGQKRSIDDAKAARQAGKLGKCLGHHGKAWGKAFFGTLTGVVRLPVEVVGSVAAATILGVGSAFAAGEGNGSSCAKESLRNLAAPVVYTEGLLANLTATILTPQVATGVLKTHRIQRVVTEGVFDPERCASASNDAHYRKCHWDPESCQFKTYKHDRGSCQEKKWTRRPRMELLLLRLP